MAETSRDANLGAAGAHLMEFSYRMQQRATMNRTLGQIEEHSRQQSLIPDDLRDEIRQLTATVAADK